jgi:predicted amidohydrolase YtcJ
VRVLVPAAIAIVLGLVQTPTPADIVIFNARVFTGDTRNPWAEAVSMRGARIAEVGTNAAVRAAKAGSEIDARGNLLIPGINDAHTHPGTLPPGTTLEGPPAMEHDPTLDEVIARVKIAVAKAPPQGWIFGEIGNNALADPRATRATFDPVTGDHPMALGSWTGHGKIFNTAALRRLSVKDDEPDPPGGTFERAADGHTLSGIAREYADYAVSRRLAMIPDRAAQLDALTRFSRELVSFGITSVQGMLTSYATEDAAELFAAVTPQIRFRLIDFPLTPMARWTAPASARVRSASPLITVSGTKWILDGTPVERMMFLRAPYSDHPSTRGRLNFTPADIQGFLQRAMAAREQPILHAVGDGAIIAALDALEATGGDRWQPLHPRLEHADMLPPQDFARAARLGVTVVQNPAHLMIAPLIQARVGADRTRQTDRVKDMLEAGVPFAIGSDGPLNPFLNIMFATINATNPSQALTVEQALTAYTAGSAAAELSIEKGILRSGLLADMALLSQDIFKVPPSELPRTVSLLTIVNGRVVHSTLDK